MPNKSTFAIYEMWELSENSSLRFYYFTTSHERKRQWVIKNNNAVPKNRVISKDEASAIIKGKQSKMVFRYWDRDEKRATKIEQQSNKVRLSIGQSIIDMTESSLSVLKRIIK